MSSRIRMASSVARRAGNSSLGGSLAGLCLFKAERNLSEAAENAVAGRLQIACGSGVVRGTIETDANQQLRIRLRTDGLGPAWTGDAQFPLTGELQGLLKQPAALLRVPLTRLPPNPACCSREWMERRCRSAFFAPVRTTPILRAWRSFAERWSFR